jgi:hypothetical protein
MEEWSGCSLRDASPFPVEPSGCRIVRSRRGGDPIGLKLVELRPGLAEGAIDGEMLVQERALPGSGDDLRRRPGGLAILTS